MTRRRRGAIDRAVALLAVPATAVVAVVAGVLAPATEVGAAGTYRSLDAPQRLVDTRPGGVTADGTDAATGLRPAGSTLTVHVGDRAGLPSRPVAVVVNVTVAEPSDAGFVTVYPCSQERPNASNLNYLAGQTVPNAVIATVDESATICLYTLSAAHLIVDASGWFEDTAYAPTPAPRRLLDTRPGRSTVDGQRAGEGALPAGAATALQVSGRGDVPDGAPAVALNVTATGGAGPGFVTVYPCDTAVPTASNVNFTAGATVPNLVVSKLSTQGTVCLYSPTTVDLIVDVSGVLPASTFSPLAAPVRLADTRTGSATADGAFAGAGAQPSGASLQLRVAGRLGIPANASSVVLNVTAVAPAGEGFITVHPRGTDRPTASNVNYAAGDVVANTVVARVGGAGDICLFDYAATDVIVDVAGWLTGPPPPVTDAGCPSLVPTDPWAPLGLIHRPVLQVALGVDRVAVLACDLPGGSTSIDPAAVADWANQEVTPWFLEASRGAYQPVFEVHPLVRISRTSQFDCILDGPALTGAPFTNVLVVDTSDYGGGIASPGFIDDRFDVGILDVAPNVSERGAWVGGGAAHVHKSVVIHEIGHTIHWPHSGLQPDAYDNVIDIMSGYPLDFNSYPPPGYCQQPDGSFEWCAAQNTLAFNRMVAGWVDGTQVAVHGGGRVNYTLDRPMGPGVQMVAVTNPFVFGKLMTIEARPRLGRDDILGKGGVAIHLVDQGDGSFYGISTQRRQRQVVGAANEYQHVLAPGESLTANGVTVAVLAAIGDGYQVSVTGTYAPPATV